MCLPPDTEKYYVPEISETRTGARIVAAVKLKREVLEGVQQQQDIVSIAARYAKSSLFTDDKRQAEKLKKRLKSLMRRKYFPLADRSGRKSAAPILSSLGKTPYPDLTGESLGFMSKYKSANLKWFLTKMDTASETMRGEIKAAIIRAARDGISKKDLVRSMTDAAREEMAAMKSRRALLAKANRALAKAESKGDIKLIKAARRARAKARAAVNRVESPLARFENKVQAAARDSVRREAQRSQLSAYKQSGYKAYTWVAVNGAVACPDCAALHGETRSLDGWAGRQPGDGHTVCGDSCMCELVPESFTDGNEQIAGPINPYLDI